MTNITVSMNKISAEIEYNHQCVYLLIMMYNNIGDDLRAARLLLMTMIGIVLLITMIGTVLLITSNVFV